jgi:hypothetical protein
VADAPAPLGFHDPVFHDRERVVRHLPVASCLLR